jgi:hypothetical protein
MLERKGFNLSRRAMLGASAATIMGFQVKDLLAWKGQDHAAKAEHVIFFWNGGGMTHLDTWDPKPGRPTQGEFEPIETSASGIQISEIFPEFAQQMHNVSLIRSIAGVNGDHGRASYQVQTSYQASANLRHPGFGSVVVHEKEKLGDLPAFVSIGGRARGSSYLGQRCEAYFVGQPGDKDPYLAFPEGITTTRGNKRLDVLNRFNGKFADRTTSQELNSTKTSVEDAVRLMRSPALKAFELEHVKAETMNRYGDTPFGRGCLVAKQLVEQGVRFVQVNRGGFDTHSNNFEAMRNHGEIMDPALASLTSDLAESGLLEKTLIVMLSEFGRTPKINDNGGRDHYPSVFSCFMAGGGIKGGQVIGSSDKDGFKPKDRPVRVPELHATLCHALGINPNKEVMTPLQRPMKLVDEAKPVLELFG